MVIYNDSENSLASLLGCTAAARLLHDSIHDSRVISRMRKIGAGGGQENYC